MTHPQPVGPQHVAPVLALAALLLPVLQAAPPSINRIEPRGAQRGKALRLEIYGGQLASDARLVSEIPGTLTPLAPDDKPMAPALVYLLEVDAEAPVGLYPLRVETKTGLSNLVLFSVGAFPETAEKETAARAANDSPESAQPVELPVTVNGRLQGPDRDVYRFRLKAGERVSVAVEARRNGSAIDPVLRVLDSDGKQLAINSDAPTLGHDARLSFRAPSDGDYFAVVHDAKYSKQAVDFYRLKIGDFDFADAFFPLGGKRGETVEVEWSGGSLAKPQRTTVDLSAVEPHRRWTTVAPPGRPGALPVVFTVGDHDERVESRDRRLTPGRIVNGRISDTGEVDRYSLAVEPGQSWRISADAAGLGSSDLFALLSVYHGDKLLARSGDEIPEKGTTTLEENTRVSRDPFVAMEVPEGVDEVAVVVEDLVQRGGPAFGYRLLAEQGEPDFELTLNTPNVTVPAGGVAYVSATAVRRGFAGPIQLKLEEAPDGVTTEGGHIAAAILTKDIVGSTSAGTLGLHAAPDAPAQNLTLAVWGEAVLPDGKIIRRRAGGPGLVAGVRSRAGIRAREQPARADWLGADLPTAVAEGFPARIEVDGPTEVRIVRGTEYPLRYRLASDDPSIKALKEFRLGTGGAREATVSPRDPEAEKAKDGAYVKYLRTTMGGPEQKFNITLTAEARINGRDEQLAAPIITIEVVEGFALEPASEIFSAAPGKEFVVAGKVTRDAGFDNPITVRAEELPQGVECEESTAEGATADFGLACSAAPETEPGVYEVRLAGSSFMAGRGEGKNVPYQIEPMTITLEIQ